MNDPKLITRRTLLATAGAAVTLPSIAWGSGMIDYTPGMVQQRLAAGETVLVDFAADWCTTCRRQERVLEELRAENPAYNDAISFVRVDWDQYGRGDLSTSLSIPRRSTLVLLRGDQELGRLVAETRRGAIASLLDMALA